MKRFAWVFFFEADRAWYGHPYCLIVYHGIMESKSILELPYLML